MLHWDPEEIPFDTGFKLSVVVLRCLSFLVFSPPVNTNWQEKRVYITKCALCRCDFFFPVFMDFSILYSDLCVFKVIVAFD